ncbi:MAG: transposase [Flavobacteriaceae bacterium]|nr:transposase [Flavobacteriaceae bacterium]
MIHDRFHWIPYWNKAIDQVRRREVKKQEVLKKARLVILQNEDNRTEKKRNLPKSAGK